MDIVVGVVTIVAGLFAIARGWVWLRDQKARQESIDGAPDARTLARDEHDRSIAASELLNENRLEAVLDDLGRNHMIDNEGGRHLADLHDLLTSTESEFLNEDLRRGAAALAGALEALRRTMAEHFFPMRGSTTPYTYLRPDWNVDRGDPSPEQRAKYETLADLLDSRIVRVRGEYQDFRRAIKQNVMV